MTYILVFSLFLTLLLTILKLSVTVKLIHVKYFANIHSWLIVMTWEKSFFFGFMHCYETSEKHQKLSWVINCLSLFGFSEQKTVDCGLNNRKLFPHSLETGSPRSKCQPILFLAHGWPRLMYVCITFLVVLVWLDLSLPLLVRASILLN